MMSRQRETEAPLSRALTARLIGSGHSEPGPLRHHGNRSASQELSPMASSASVEGTILPLGRCMDRGRARLQLFALRPARRERGALALRRGGPRSASPRVPAESSRQQDMEHLALPVGGTGGRDARYYAYRVDGPRAAGPGRWHAYDPRKVLLDPNAKEVFFPPEFDRTAAQQPGSNLGRAPLGVLPCRRPYIAPSDERHPRHDPDSVVIYEMHVRGFTQSPTSGLKPERRGTFAGVVDQIPHLKELGVTMVELQPVQQFDPQEGNYWGYMTLNFFAPHNEYAADPRNAPEEFRAMVSALHAAGIEVILDVVYNHTAEGGVGGPTYSFRGIDNAEYYVMSDDPRSVYRDYTGCGNTLACTSICTWTLILESLRYWVTEMHVDGFRFDLASVLGRGPNGTFENADTSLLTAIRTDPILRHAHLIAEPWDAGWAFQLGTKFPGKGWCQWNGRFRDDVRRFVRGDPGMVGRSCFGSTAVTTSSPTTPEMPTGPLKRSIT